MFLLEKIVRLPRLLLIGLVRVYQLIISPHVPSSCRFTPSCSEYAAQAIREYGAIRGFILTMRRLARCHPWGGHGYDPPRWFGEPEDAEGASEVPRRSTTSVNDRSGNGSAVDGREAEDSFGAATPFTTELR
jgi:uncharacterized protein